MSLLQLPHEIVILDFWTTSCGICFKKFPELQELYDKYKPDDRVGIYAVNLLLKNQELEFVKENKHLMKYTFPQLYTSFEYSKNIQKHFDFNKVPTVVIIDDGRLIYRGQLNIKDYILVNNTIDFIENALNNEKIKTQFPRVTLLLIPLLFLFLFILLLKKVIEEFSNLTAFLFRLLINFFFRLLFIGFFGIRFFYPVDHST